MASPGNAKPRIIAIRRYPLALVLTMLGMLCVVVACARLTQKPELPRISVVGLEVLQTGVLEKHYALKLRLQNTNDVDLAIKGMVYEVFINDRPFAHGVSRQHINLPSFGEAVVELQLVSNLGRVIEQVQGWESPFIKHLHYRIIGAVKLDNWSKKLPFETTGELAPAQKDGYL